VTRTYGIGLLAAIVVSLVGVTVFQRVREAERPRQKRQEDVAVCMERRDELDRLLREKPLGDSTAGTTDGATENPKRREYMLIVEERRLHFRERDFADSTGALPIAVSECFSRGRVILNELADQLSLNSNQIELLGALVVTLATEQSGLTDESRVDLTPVERQLCMWRTSALFRKEVRDHLGAQQLASFDRWIAESGGLTIPD
jgi:hypothetical protein